MKTKQPIYSLSSFSPGLQNQYHVSHCSKAEKKTQKYQYPRPPVTLRHLSVKLDEVKSHYRKPQNRGNNLDHFGSWKHKDGFDLLPMYFTNTRE